MQSQININIAVDVMKALSDQSLHHTMYMMDDSVCGSMGQGTDHLCTMCISGQTIRWVAYPLDVQTPVAIKAITFLPSGEGSNGEACGMPVAGHADEQRIGEENAGNSAQSYLDNPNVQPDLKTWKGVLPYLQPGRQYRYRLELQMGNGKDSCLSVETASLCWACPSIGKENNETDQSKKEEEV